MYVSFLSSITHNRDKLRKFNNKSAEEGKFQVNNKKQNVPQSHFSVIYSSEGFFLPAMVIKPIIDNRQTNHFWSLSFVFFIKINMAPWPLSSIQKKNDRTNLLYDGWWCLYVAHVMELMIRSWVDFQLGSFSYINMD